VSRCRDEGRWKYENEECGKDAKGKRDDYVVVMYQALLVAVRS
jgi:hypothetical protein